MLFLDELDVIFGQKSNYKFNSCDILINTFEDLISQMFQLIMSNDVKQHQVKKDIIELLQKYGSK